MAALDGICDLWKRAVAGQEIGRNLATLDGRLGSFFGRIFGSILGARCGRGAKPRQQRQSQDGSRAGSHRLPPARSALPMVFLVRALLSAECLYHENSHAAPDMMRIPPTVTTACSAAPPETSASTKWPAKARNTPRQKISSECCPHRISGRSHGDFSPAQSFGRNRTVSAASARKCAKRSTSRSVLSIGYIHCSSQRGSQVYICGTYQVSVT